MNALQLGFRKKVKYLYESVSHKRVRITHGKSVFELSRFDCILYVLTKYKSRSVRKRKFGHVRLAKFITKTRLFKYTENLSTKKNENF